jgi:hypothetical protein
MAVMLAQQNRLPLIGGDSAQPNDQAATLPALRRALDYRDVRQIFVSHEGETIPISVETAAEMMHRRIFVHHYQEGEKLYLRNTEPQFVRPVDNEHG